MTYINNIIKKQFYHRYTSRGKLGRRIKMSWHLKSII
jgi:hypothetical protein